MTVGKAEMGYAWASWSDDKLLDTRICDLRLKLPNSDVEPLVDRLHGELSDRDVHFHPRAYLTTEWLCPDRVPLIGVPFCLAHPRLYALEKSMMLEIEGGTEKSFMQLIRHEAGHAINYAYRLYARTRWRELFGPISQEYNVQEYFPRPYSHQFVEHLPGHYAQSHPDEDFAETFAVWMTPDINWREKYRGWKAIKKLDYVHHVMNKIGNRPPVITGGEELWPVNRVRSTLRTYYRKKQRDFGDGYPGYYDPALEKLFTREATEEKNKAWTFLRENQRNLTNQIAYWGRFKKYEVDRVLGSMYLRAKELRLYLPDGEHEALNRICICLTALLSDNRNRNSRLET